MIRNIEALISKIYTIHEKYQKIYKESGLEYNIFKVIRKTNDEVHLHTKIIADLLNPNGSHGLKNLPFKIFIINCLDKQNIEIGDNEGFTVLREKLVSEHGRIDILITGKKFCIAIENKLDAQDQPKQLWRYAQFLKTHKQKTSHLLYLTKDGSKATNESMASDDKNINPLMEKDYLRISYESHVLKWLEELLKELEKESTNKAWIIEPLKQYINLIKEEVGLSITKEQDDEILNTIKKNEYFNTALQIFNSFERAAESIKDDIIKYLKRKLSEKYPLDVDDHQKGDGEIIGCEVKIDHYRFGIWWDNFFNDTFYYGVQSDNKKLMDDIIRILSDVKFESPIPEYTLPICTEFCYNGNKDEYRSFLNYLENPSVLDSIVDGLVGIIKNYNKNKR